MVKRAQQGEMTPSALKKSCLEDAAALTPVAVPKPVLAAQKIIQEAGLTEPSGNELKGILSVKQFGAVSDCFRKFVNGNPNVKEEYVKATTDEQRRNLIAMFVMDPAACKQKGFNRTVVSNADTDETEGAWLMEAQLAGPSYLNSSALAKCLVESGELPQRANEFECFRTA